jgi:hypothetical protein
MARRKAVFETASAAQISRCRAPDHDARLDP